MIIPAAILAIIGTTHAGQWPEADRRGGRVAERPAPITVPEEVFEDDMVTSDDATDPKATMIPTIPSIRTGSRTTRYVHPSGAVTTVTVSGGPATVRFVESPGMRREVTRMPNRIPMPQTIRPHPMAQAPSNDPKPGEYAGRSLDDVHGARSSRPFRVRRDPWSGHYVADVVINGVRTKAIIDTGASVIRRICLIA